MVDFCCNFGKFGDGDELDVDIWYWFDCWIVWVSGINVV